MTKLMRFLICWAMLVAPVVAAPTTTAPVAHPQVAQSPANQSALTPTYWNQRLFYIPYQVNKQSRLLDPVAKVQLLYSRTGTNDWQTLEEAQPNVQGFSYHAPEDGTYWFALRHLDRLGRPWPNDQVQPQLHLVVDTVEPTLNLSATLEATGQVVVRYDARDANLSATSLQVEVRSAAGQWVTLRVGEPDIAQPDRLLGRVLWQPPASLNQLEFRASIADKAGLRVQANTMVATSTTASGGPALHNPLSQIQNPQTFSARAQTPQQHSVIANPFTTSNLPATPTPVNSPRQLPAQDWPTNNQLPVTAPSNQQLASTAPPVTNPYTTTNRNAPQRTPAQLVGDGTQRTAQGSGPQSLQITPLGSDDAPPLVGGINPNPMASANTAGTGDQWAAVNPSTANQSIAGGPATLVVNSLTFDIEYDLQAVGPWGIAKVELWGTQDNGRSWQSYGVDPDNRSPIRATVAAAGTYGFRILVDGANSAGATPPQSGDQPELTVSVDLQPPTAELTSAELGEGNLAGHLVLRWAASDTNLEARPIALFYSSLPNGPWSTIATGLENTGSYTWRIERHVPSRFYIRLEALDTAGNLATYHSPTPLTLDRPQPTGQLRTVRPVTGGSAR